MDTNCYIPGEEDQYIIHTTHCFITADKVTTCIPIKTGTMTGKLCQVYSEEPKTNLEIS